ncbi:MAG: hypothetical protein R3D71_06110 [Rickettsiales bacterium]
MLKPLEKHRLVVFVLLGLVIQFSIVFYLLSSLKNSGMIGGVIGGAIVYYYLIFYQWIGYLLQLIITWFICKKETLKVFVLTLCSFYILLFVYIGIHSFFNARYISNQMEEDKKFYAELEKLKADLPQNIKISFPEIVFLCPSTSVDGSIKEYESINFSFLTDFTVSGEYYVDIYYYDVGKEVNRRLSFDVPENGEYLIDWELSGYYLGRKFVNSGKSSLASSLNSVRLELYHMSTLKGDGKTKISTKLSDKQFLLSDKLTVKKIKSAMISSSDYRCPINSEIKIRKKLNIKNMEK